MKKRNIDNILAGLTPKKREEMKQENIKHLKTVSTEYWLGVFVGEEIVRKTLPTLDIDLISTNNVIKVLDLDRSLYEEIYNELQNSVIDNEYNKDVWEKYMNFRRNIEKKYLLNTIIHQTKPMFIENMADFKLGIANALWNSDVCHYSCDVDKIDVKMDDNYYFLNITLVRE